MTWSAPNRSAKTAAASSGGRPPAAGSPRTIRTWIPAAAGPARSARPESQSPFSKEQTGRGRQVDLEQRVTRPWPGRPRPTRPGSARPGSRPPRSVTARHPAGSSAIRGRSGQRDGRRVEQDERRRPDPDRGQARGGHRAPAVADDLEIRDVAARRRGAHAARSAAVSRNSDRPVQCPVRPCPGRSTATTRRAGRRQGRPDPPPDLRGGGHAVDQDQRPVAGLAPGSAENGSPAASSRIARARRRRARERPDAGHRRHDRCGQRHGGRHRGGHASTPVAGGARLARTGMPVAEVHMANQFVVQLKNEPGAMATWRRRSPRAASTCARSAAAASATAAT